MPGQYDRLRQTFRQGCAAGKVGKTHANLARRLVRQAIVTPRVSVGGQMADGMGRHAALREQEGKNQQE